MSISWKNPSLVELYNFIIILFKKKQLIFLFLALYVKVSLKNIYFIFNIKCT